MKNELEKLHAWETMKMIALAKSEIAEWKTFYVEAGCGWYLLNARNIVEAKRDARKEYSVSYIKIVRLAKKREIGYYLTQRMAIGEAE